jgi:hypothetical protein
MANSCDDLFQRKLDLDLQRQENDAELAKLKQIQASRSVPPDDNFNKAWRQYQEERLKREDQAIPSEEEFDQAWTAYREAAQKPANKQDVDEGLNAAQTPGERPPAVNIAEGQPVNFDQLVRNHPEDVVREYALVTKSLREAGVKAMPDEFRLDGYTNVGKQAEMLQTLTTRGNKAGWIRVLSQASGKFENLVTEVTMGRYVNDTAKKAYVEGLQELQAFVRDNPGTAYPDDAKLKLFRQFKVALMAQRQFDYIRGGWARVGHALQGKGFESSLIQLEDMDVVRAVDEAADTVGDAATKPTVADAAAMTAKDLTEDQSFSKVLKGVDLLQTDPAAGMRQLEMEVGNIILEGVEPRMLSPFELSYNRLKRFNLLAKDWMLFNERTNALNVGSNGIMALFGPYRKFFEDLQEFRQVQGTSISRAANDAWHAQWEGLGASYLAIRDAGKEVFMDAFKRGKAMYSNNVDTYGARYQTTDELLAELRDLQQGGASGQGLHRRAVSLINPERYGRYFHAGFRLWMYQKTGQRYWLRPGLQTMAAADNVMGFASSVYHVRHDLEVKARKGGRQMQFADADDPAKAMNDWIDKQFVEQFYSDQPTAAQRIKFRKEQGITADLLDDAGIDDMIMESRVGRRHQVPEGQQGPSGPVTYGGMVPGDLTRNASGFSEEMRFANTPGIEGGPVRKLYMGAKALQQHPWVESNFPFFQAPFLGTGFDLEMSGLPGLARLTQKMTDEQRRRNTANMIMAGHVWALWGGLSASGLITTNGPTNPEQRKEWQIRMKAEGREPNSIAGVPLPGGFPIINTVFLMESIKENAEYAAWSKYDQLSVVEAVTGVLLGHLSRSSAIGQIQTLMEVAYADRGMGSKVMDFAGYMASGRYLPSGPMRSLARGSNSQLTDLYSDAGWTEQDFDDIPTDLMETWERRLRNVAYAVTPLSGAFGGQYKDKDWLGTSVRKPFGFDTMTYLKNRFSPVEHPQDSIYMELDYLDLLSPPEELESKSLRDIPMTDDLQKWWNDSYGEMTGGNTIVLDVGVPAKVQVKVPLYDITTPKGVRFKEDATLFEIDMNLFLPQFVDGNTPAEAFRALFKSDLYKKMEAAEATSYSTDAPRAERRRTPAALMVRAIKRHYAEMTTAKALNMQNPPPEVVRWREMYTAKNAKQQQEAMENAGGSIRALTEAIGGAE